MNIKDFLIDNYIWILVVILLTIITIIGFLADKKKGKKEPKNAVSTGGNNYTNAQPINYQNVGMSSPVNYQQGMNLNNPNMGGMNIPNPMGIPNNPANFQTIPNSPLTPNNTIATMPQINQTNDMNLNNPQGNLINNGMENSQMGLNNGIVPSPAPTPQPLDQFSDINMGSSPVNQINVIPNNNPQPIENVNNNNLINAEPMYQPLSEQKPIIAPKEVPNFNQNQVNLGNPMGNMPNGGLQPEQINPQVNMNYQQPINNPLNQQTPINLNQNPAIGNTIPSPVQNPNGENQSPVNFVYGPQNNNNNNNN